jgi:serine/threonine protein kinase
MACAEKECPRLCGGSGRIGSDCNKKPWVESELEWNHDGKNITCSTIEIGCGAYGRVFEGKLDEEPVAVKITRPHFGTPARNEAEIVGLFQDERSIAQIHLLFITTNGYRPDHPVIVMPLYGVNFLTEYRQWRLEEGKVPWTVLRCLLLDVSRALDAMARQHVSHLDLKPENIMRKTLNWKDPEPQYVLGDFNCAKRHLELLPFQSNVYVVSRYYRPPEVILQCRSTSARPGTNPRIDVWSFGSMVPEFLTGMPIFCPTKAASQSTLLVIARVLGPPPQAMLDDHWKNFYFCPRTSKQCIKDGLMGQIRLGGSYDGPYYSLHDIVDRAEELYGHTEGQVMQQIWDMTLRYNWSERSTPSAMHKKLVDLLETKDRAQQI